MTTRLEKDYRSVHYAPPGEYFKDHTFVRYRDAWHVFSISGRAGEDMVTQRGNEETFSHSVSRDLCDWKAVGHCLELGPPGAFDADMIWAPYVAEKEGQFYMFYTGCIQPFRSPDRWFEGHHRQIGLAVSSDLVTWKKTELPVVIPGKDPHVLYDERRKRWILYVSYPGIGAWVSEDLIHWHDPVQAYQDAPEHLACVYESPYVFYYPGWDRYILFLNLGYAVSQDPLSFKGFHPYHSDLPEAPTEWLKTQKFFHPKIGFAGEVLTVNGACYRSACWGPLHYWKLTFFKIAFLDNFVVTMF